MKIHILKGGSLTTVQDLGREATGHLGLPPSGALDIHALQIANRCVGNDPHMCGLEFTLMGPELSFSDDTWITISGARFASKLSSQENKLIPLNRAVRIKAHEVLKIGPAVSGARGYLAILGGIDVPTVFGSRSTYLRSQIGGFCGRALKTGDILESNKNSVPNESSQILRGWQGSTQVSTDGMIKLRVFPSSQTKNFSEEELSQFYSEIYSLRPDSDRMGFRFAGKPLVLNRPMDIASEASLPGNIQIASNGLPTILGRDCPATGGYSKIGTIYAADFGQLAYLRPGDKVKFLQGSIDDAKLALSNFEKHIENGFTKI